MARKPTIITRRAIGAATALLALSGGAAQAVSASVRASDTHRSQPDAELIELGRQLAAEWAKMDAWDATSPHGVTDEELAAMMAPGHLLVDRIEHMQAHTHEGLLVKAQAVSWCNSGEEIDPDRFCPYPGAATDGRIAASIVRNLLGRA